MLLPIVTVTSPKLHAPSRPTVFWPFRFTVGLCGYILLQRIMCLFYILPLPKSLIVMPHSPDILQVLGICSCLVLGFFLLAPRRKPSSRSFPPGPPGKFLVGNLQNLPRGGSEWVKHRDLARQYNDPVFFRVFGKPVISINSAAVANDLLEGKGLLYSDRPRLPSVKELAGYGWNLILKSYHEGWAAHRKVVAQRLHPSIVHSQYRPVMEQEVLLFLKRLQARPDNLFKSIKLTTGAIIVMITYGHQVTDEADPYIEMMEQARAAGEKTLGAALVDIVPFFQHIPTWFPGAAFKRHALSRRKNAQELRAIPYNNIKRDLADGTAAPSIVSALIEDVFSGAGELTELDIQDLGGTFYTTGADTTATAVINFVLAMMLYPDVQRKAQDELDAVVGRHRLPGFGDRENLSYIPCVLKELLRWRPVAPLAAPHYTTEDDEYNGWHIPAHTTVIPNIWAILHDEETYSDPESFIPERFIGAAKEADPAFVFGFGRRVCPGRFFADDSLFLLVASILHVFTISKPRDEAGTEFEPAVTWSSGLVSVPTLFPYTLSARQTVAPELGFM
ncbi:cytochrome P450 [Mycena belliarum]|uniref:Cytochrome P450 n=1 Tax=Mycena belliarum TaxID=1033014 RepID=A0AAD6XKU9_9AGAR|nr:cytochrome P450 [Mycena belliae]